MADQMVALALAAVASTVAPDAAPLAHEHNWCTPGYTVMVPDGREGLVTSTDGDICRVLADGEGYVSLWAYYLVEPVYPQIIARRQVGH